MNEKYDFDEGDSDGEGFDVSDDEYSDDDNAETLPCPECGQAIYEEAEQCPHCGQYVTFSATHAFDNKPWWWIALGLLGVLALIWWLVTAGG